MFRVFKHYVFTILTLVSGSITIVLFLAKLNPSEEGKWSIIFLGVFTIIFFFESLYYRIIWGRQKQYGSALAAINSGFMEVHFTMRDNTLTREKIYIASEKICTHLSLVFSSISGTTCSSSIKLIRQQIVENSLNLQTTTLARDMHSSKTRFAANDKINHDVFKNTAFSTIFSKIGYAGLDHYFSNKLPFLGNYENTSFEIYGNPNEIKNKTFKNIVNFFRVSTIVKFIRWTLPYKSTIVVPICPGINRERDKKNVIGFLCIDSPNLLVFRSNYDLELMHGVADGLYNIIMKLKNIDG